MSKLPIYFSHGYREREISYNKYFGRLVDEAGFVPSLDPPSDDVNSAKLEAHLRHTVGLIAILCDRAGALSPYMRYEIDLAIRAGLPVLVFLEETIPDHYLPAFLLRSRFASKAFFRDYHNHAHSLKIFRTYIGKKPKLRYQQFNMQKSALLIGFQAGFSDLKQEVRSNLEHRGFRLLNDTESKEDVALYSGSSHFEMSCASLAICMVDAMTPSAAYQLGVVRSVHVPTILLSANPNAPINPGVPIEFQRRIVSRDVADSLAVVDDQVDLFEQDFVPVSNEGQWETYVSSLSRRQGKYSDQNRIQTIQNITMGDTYKNISGNIQSRTQGDASISQEGTFTFNQQVEASGNDALKAAFEEIARLVSESNNIEAKELLESFNRESAEKAPRKSILKTLWNGLKEVPELVTKGAAAWTTIAGWVHAL